MAEQILIRRATASDRHHLLSLLCEHLGPDADVDSYYRWLYRDNPHGPALSWIAIDRKYGEPVGVTSIFPRRVSIHGVERLGAIAGDGFVRPSFRRRGIGTDLHRACSRQMTDDGVELMYGRPGPHALKALAKVGSHVVCQLRRFVRPLGTMDRGCVSYLTRHLLAPRRTSLRLVASAGHDVKIGLLWDEAVRDLAVAPVRDPAYCAWRFASAPSRRQRHYLICDGATAVASCALEREGKRTVVLDLLATRVRWDKALEAILFACRDSESVEIRLNERGPISRRLLRHGFVPRDRKPFVVLVADRHPHASVLRRATSWYYTTGDGDLDNDANPSADW